MANINDINLTTLSFEEIRKLLSDDEIERIYRLQQLEYRIQDVEAHAAHLFGKEEISKDEMDFALEHKVEIAELFLYKYSDCNLAENDVFECLIISYLADHYKK